MTPLKFSRCSVFIYIHPVTGATKFAYIFISDHLLIDLPTIISIRSCAICNEIIIHWPTLPPICRIFNRINSQKVYYVHKHFPKTWLYRLYKKNVASSYYTHTVIKRDDTRSTKWRRQQLYPVLSHYPHSSLIFLSLQHNSRGVVLLLSAIKRRLIRSLRILFLLSRLCSTQRRRRFSLSSPFFHRYL